MDKVATIEVGLSRKYTGMSRAWEHADSDWRTAALAIVLDLARTTSTFTTDSVWEELDALGFKTHEHRAMGPVMRQAAKHNWIAKTDRVVPTMRPHANRRPIAVWQSQPHLRST